LTFLSAMPRHAALLLAVACALCDGLVVQRARVVSSRVPFRIPPPPLPPPSRLRMAAGDGEPPSTEEEGRGANPNDSLYASGADFELDAFSITAILGFAVAFNFFVLANL